MSAITKTIQLAPEMEAELLLYAQVIVALLYLTKLFVPTTDGTCEDGTVHLIGGGDISRGRVQYCHEGSWYSVCASDIGVEEARAICATLGYYRGIFGKTCVSLWQSICVYFNSYIGGFNPLLPLQIQCDTVNENVKNCHKLPMNISQCLYTAE